MLDLFVPSHLITSEEALRMLQRNKSDSAAASRLTRFLLTGDSNSAVRSFLFQAAVSKSAAGQSVLYICQQPLSSIPDGVHGMLQADYRTLQMLRFRYLTDCAALVDYLSKVHLTLTADCLPECIIVDSFDAYADHAEGTTARNRVMTTLWAGLDDAASFLSQKVPAFSLLVGAKPWSTDCASKILASFKIWSVEEVGENSIRLSESDSGAATGHISVVDSRLRLSFGRRQSTLHLEQVLAIAPRLDIWT